MNKLLTNEEYLAQLDGRGIVPLEPYKGAFKKIKHMCNICGHTWLVTPKSLKNKTLGGCPSCYQKSVRKPLDVVKQQLFDLGWTLACENNYLNSYSSLGFRHICGYECTSNIDRILRKSKRCPHCTPPKKKQFWSTTIECGVRSYSSKIEADCCEFLIARFGLTDVILQKEYPGNHRKTVDAYIKTLDLYVEVSTINKPFYLFRIYEKRKLVTNFLFVSSLEQLKQFFNLQ